MLSIILAMDKNKLVGNSKSKNGLPWHYKEDLAFYKKMTINKKNIMGSNTHKQIGKALPNRETYVLSRDKTKQYEGVVMLNNIEQVYELQKENPNEEIMIIGGVDIFEQFISDVDTIYLTLINKEYEGDIYYEKFNTKGYEMVEQKIGDNEELTFQTWRKIAS